MLLPAWQATVVLFLLFGPPFFPAALIVFHVVTVGVVTAGNYRNAWKWVRAANEIVRKLRGAATKFEANELAGGESAPDAEEINSPHPMLHLLLLPNYNEPVDLLRRTLSHLALHTPSLRSRYVVVLAMEAAERGAEGKARALIEEFGDAFGEVWVTRHPRGVVGEAVGKHTNTNWSARACTRELMQRSIPLTHATLTILDADALLPALYIPALEAAMFHPSNADPYYSYYCPPTFFGRNCHDVPAVVRATDNGWCMMHAQNLKTAAGVAFPCSNYSVPVVLAERVGYWDTGFEAIGEDMHMGLKCCFETEFRARGVPVWIPINCCNVQAPTHIGTVHARWTQAVRHYYGHADLAYVLRATWKQIHAGIVETVWGAKGLPTAAGEKQHEDGDLAPMKTRTPYDPPSDDPLALPKPQLPPYRRNPNWWSRLGGKLVAVAALAESHFMPFPVVVLTALTGPLLDLWGAHAVLTAYPNALWAYERLPYLAFATAAPGLMNFAYYEVYHRGVYGAMERMGYEGRRWAHEARPRDWGDLVDYLVSPLSAFFFMTLPSCVAVLKRFWTAGRAQEYIVGAKDLKKSKK
ncbi:hypothetical protein HDU93_008577 [Gonapodya sp. JEL0774]|nr:hypothetical protein HDU93_008577 [Gonapodya sp. JEL0774]